MGLVLQIIGFVLIIHLHSRPVLMKTTIECNDTQKAVIPATNSAHQGTRSSSYDSRKAIYIGLVEHYFTLSHTLGRTYLK